MSSWFGKPARKRVEDVFTPRRSDVNESMYVPRPDLEEALEAALRSGLHVLVHGDSGCGKTWLYKKVLDRLKIHYEVLNLANAHRHGSITAELRNLVERDGGFRKTGYIETKAASIGVPGVAGGELEHAADYREVPAEPLAACLALIRRRAGGRAAFLLLDNLEMIFDDEKLRDELASILTLIDDAAYAKHDVRIVVVGVPSGVREYFAKVRQLPTVANRIREVPEVSRLTRAQAEDLVRRGFQDELQVKFEPGEFERLQAHAVHVTDRVPQRLHEYCQEVGFECERNGWTFRPEMLDVADRKWLRSALSESYTAIEQAMNEKETKVGRRNQTIYVIGHMDGEIRASEVESRVREQFNVPKEITLNAAGTLAELRKAGLIRPSAKGDSYVFSDPRFRMCIRTMLRKDGERVGKIDIREIA